MEILLVLTGIVSLICMIYVAIQMASEGKLVLAIFGALCCQIIIFVWGWAFWQHPHKMIVMPIWTVCVLIGVVVQLVAGPPALPITP